MDGLRFGPMLVPEDLRYSEDHQWIRAEDGVCRVGITAFAQEALGEVTMVKVTCTTAAIGAGDEMGEIEAFKAMTDLYMPIEAVVIDVNPTLADSPTSVNNDPYGDGWLCTVRPTEPNDLATLLDARAYRELIGFTDG